MLKRYGESESDSVRLARSDEGDEVEEKLRRLEVARK
ncbi:hypothetical protein PC116_g2956 [Phytophthora cactorum]|uniref:Uncharacterized protein n=1 Tax=Phytophthora cactorum TaxID=29920 RepID=A0A8T1LIF2_9STRA|nr:hypothetical protein Pcac1_g13382 [Phytophthora cactorum]KAG2906674.1 hypothetical protein PC114_g11074 [Phytophthora cactorum]KAG2939890.1 hypothetical protein PC117_g10759 [Phytophthora cactorum]KAG3014924.1 hypothetical protein PC119_g11969 [Phytophthora cactorum]KAG3017709.1 hypothetical protein PC120_g10873 [Phytophthora cactorum]